MRRAFRALTVGMVAAGATASTVQAQSGNELVLGQAIALTGGIAEHGKAVDPAAEHSFPNLQAYLSAKVLVEGLRRAGAKAGREELVTALEGLGSYDAGGVFVNYSRTSREVSSFVDTVIATSDGRFVH